MGDGVPVQVVLADGSEEAFDVFRDNLPCDLIDARKQGLRIGEIKILQIPSKYKMANLDVGVSCFT